MIDARPGDIFQPGDLLNNTYRIEAILGRGGTSEVYRARSEISGRVVALKALKSEFSRNEDYLVLMTREEDIREIRHDVIVRYYDNQRTDDGRVYLVMDYIDGPGLDLKLKQGGMRAADLLKVARRVAEGLQAAHAKKIIHRDLSPDNIILRNGDPEQAVIIDFGIAKDANVGAQTIVGNEFAGKYAYAAPEQLSGQTDARADIYALGALLLAVYRGKAPNLGNNLMEVVRQKSLPLDTEGVPEPLKSLIDRMTHPDREQRLQSAAAVLEALDTGDAPGPETSAAAAVDSDKTVVVPPASRPPRPPATARQTASDAAKTPAARTPAQRKPRRTGMLMVVLGLVAVVTAGTGGYVYGLFDPYLAPRYAAVSPYTLVAERRSDGSAQAVGHVPSAAVQSELVERMAALDGTTDLTLASGEIADSWGTDVLELVQTVWDLPEWRIAVSDNEVEVTGLTEDREDYRRVMAALEVLPPALSGSAAIDLGPRFLSPSVVQPLLRRFADCGELNLVDPPFIGYPMDATITVSGRVAEAATRVQLSDAIAEIAGHRQVRVAAEVLNPTLCLIEAALPSAPEGGFDVVFGFGDRDEPNPSGRYLVGENPVIDVRIPSGVDDGYLFVSILDVSGNVYHLLPNVNNDDNSVETLRAGEVGPVSIRVAYGLEEAEGTNRLAFLVDDNEVGKSKVLVIHADSQIFDGLRPTTESAGGYVSALRARIDPIRSLDSRILETARP
jgi:eukaryotic-like serine/threonine-protein kinase